MKFHYIRLGFFLLFLLSISFAITYGPARQIVERSWSVVSSAPFEFNGSLPVNNSNQRIVSITMDPEMVLHTNDDGMVWLTYSGNGSATLNVTLVVDVNYNPKIISDSEIPDNSPVFTNLTEPDDKITFRAESLSNSSSSLATIRDVVEWVHSYITYDLDYSGKFTSAQEVFVHRRGVCVEYSHLLISMLKSIGFEARYVSGYVYTTVWQPHAWVEVYVPGYGWLAADPTFNQIGSLDNSHIAIAYGSDQKSIYDSITTTDTNASISINDDIRTNYQSDDPKGVELEIMLENHTVVFDITNSRPYYTYGTLTTFMFDSQDGQLLLLNPSEKISISKPMDESHFQEGFIFTVPVVAWFNDARANASFVIDTSAGGEDGTEVPSQCLPALILASALLFAFKN